MASFTAFAPFSVNARAEITFGKAMTSSGTAGSVMPSPSVSIISAEEEESVASTVRPWTKSKNAFAIPDS